MSEQIYKQHNKTLLLNHIVFHAKYRRSVFSIAIEETLQKVCLGISERYEIRFLEIGTDEDHVHFLVQSVPNLSITRIVTLIKSITARHIFKRHHEVKKELWGGNLWTSGYYANTVGSHGIEDVIQQYVREQGRKNFFSFSNYLCLMIWSDSDTSILGSRYFIR